MTVASTLLKTKGCGRKPLNYRKSIRKHKIIAKRFAIQAKSRKFAQLFHQASVGMQSSPLSWVGTDNNTFNYPSTKWQI